MIKNDLLIRPLRNQKGFSLIEVIIGVTILSAMSLLMYATTNRSLEGKARVEHRDEGLHGIRVGLERMVDDIGQAFTMRPKTPNDDSAEFMAGLDGKGDQINFSTMGHFHYVKDDKDTDTVTVGYFLKRNSQGLNNLMRRESQRLSKKLDEGGPAHVLIENVKSLKLEYYDSAKKEWSGDWDSTSISSLGRLPMAVKIELVVVEKNDEDPDDRGSEHTYTTMAPIGLYKNEVNL